MDFLTIADALADRYDPTVVTPPTGFKDITTSTARLPNNIPNTPFVIVWADNGELNYLKKSGVREGDHEFLVNFYYSKAEGDAPRQIEALLSWLGVLIDQLHGQPQLGLGGNPVMKAFVMNWKLGTLVYGGTTYHGITLTVHVWTQDNVTWTL